MPVVNRQTILISLLLFPIAISITLFSFRDSFADTPFTNQEKWSGKVDFFVSGAPLAIDTYGDGKVDADDQPVSITVSSNDIPTGASLKIAYLYWGGTQSQTSDACSTLPDKSISFDVPNASAQVVVADVCHCSDGGSSSYDVHSCRADVTDVIHSGTLLGTYTLDDYEGLINNGATDNASFSIIFIYEDDSLPWNTVILSDGLEVFINNSKTYQITGFDIATSPSGEFAYYVFEGDVGGAGTEKVEVEGSGGVLTVSDAFNPIDNPMNHTINVLSTPATDSIGVDIDRFDISSALDVGDTSIDITYHAGMDKWWLVYQIVSIETTAKYQNYLPVIVR